MTYLKWKFRPDEPFNLTRKMVIRILFYATIFNKRRKAYFHESYNNSSVIFLFDILFRDPTILVATFRNFRSSSKIVVIEFYYYSSPKRNPSRWKTSRDQSPSNKSKKNLSNRRILRKNQEKLRELEERSMTGGKMECIIEGTDNSKESSLSLSKYRNLYSVNNRLAIVRPALCSGMSHALRIIDRPCVEHRRL